MQAARGMWIVAAVALGTSVACSEGNVLGPSNQLEVTNARDSFQLQATALDDVSQTLSYRWSMTGDRADVNQSGSLENGTATLTILDGLDREVYSRSLSQTGTFHTSAGTAGSWTITVVLERASGVVNFRVQKP